MECTSEKCKRKLRKRLQIIHSSVNDSSESSLSSDSESKLQPFYSLPRKRRKASCHSRRDYLSRLFERKKLKDKSLSKKLRTPFDRKINRTCWPIELRKVSRIKKKPHEKRREKPTYRSLSRRKFSDPLFISGYREDSPQIISSELDDDSVSTRRKFSNHKVYSKFRARSPQITCSELEFLDDESFNVVYQHLNKKHYIHRQISPVMLMEVLQDPEYSKTGATINMIIEKLRALNLNLNPTTRHYKTLQDLKEDIAIKLLCAIKLGIIKEENGHYKIAEMFRNDESSREKVNFIWNWWYRRMKKMRK